jgi:IS30 family transposase
MLQSLLCGGRLKKEGIISLHHETIYPHILVDKKAGGELYKHLYVNEYLATGVPSIS